MEDDWRLQIDLHEEGAAHKLTERLDARDLKHDLETAFHDRVIVSVDGSQVFCYAGTREQITQAEKLIRSVAAEHGWHLKCDLKHWHPAEEAWESPDKSLPRSDAEQTAEHASLMERQRQEAATRGYSDFEVRVECPSHHEAMQLADRLREEGLPSVHRWKYVLVGAPDEDSAKALAARLEAEAPARSKVRAEGTWRAAVAEGPSNPFAVFGGLGQ